MLALGEMITKMKLKQLLEGKKWKKPGFDREKGPSEVLKRMGQPEYRQRVEKPKRGKGSYVRAKKLED